MQRGTPVWEAAGFLAMSKKMLREVYGHHHPDFQKEAAENIGSRQNEHDGCPRNVRVIA